jgi:hypothetical protein
MSNVLVPTDVKFNYGSLSWNVSWKDMIAVDDRGRSWKVKKDGDRLYLDFENKIQATITVPDVYKSHENYHSRFAKRWLSRNLIE